MVLKTTGSNKCIKNYALGVSDALTLFSHPLTYVLRKRDKNYLSHRHDKNRNSD